MVQSLSSAAAAPMMILKRQARTLVGLDESSSKSLVWTAFNWLTMKPAMRNDALIKRHMEDQGLDGDPSKHLVIWGYNKIADRNTTYEVDISLDRPLSRGAYVWARCGPGPELTPVRVYEDSGSGPVWCWNPEGTARFKVPWSEVKPCPIPLRPKAIHKRELKLYIGRAGVKDWNEKRRSRSV